MNNDKFNNLDNNLDKLLEEITQIKPLTKEEEISLFKRFNNGDKESVIQELIKVNLPLIIEISKDYTDEGIPLCDLIQAGNLGLIKAIENFNYKRFDKFKEYASWWIRNSIVSCIKQVKSENIEYVAKLEKIHSIKEMEVLRLDFQKKKVDLFFQSKIKKALKFFSFKERAIIRFMFGLDGSGKKSLEEIETNFELPKEEIIKIEKKLFEILQTYFPNPPDILA